MALFSFSKPKKELILVVDIGSASVGAAVSIITTDKSSAPLIIASSRTQIPFQERLKFDRFTELMLIALETSVAKVLAVSKARPEKTYCFLASPWYASQVRTSSLSKDKEFKVTADVFESLVNEEIEKFKKNEAAAFAELKDKMIFIEKEVMDISLNGYRAENPFSSLARELKVSLFLGVAPKEVMKRIEERIRKNIPYTAIAFHTFLFPYYNVISSISGDKKDFLLADAGGEITDIALIRDGKINESISFPLGKNFLLRWGAELSNRQIEEVRSLILLWSNGKLNSAAKERTKEIFAPIRAEWLKVFHKSLEQVSKGVILPSTFFIAADGEVIRWFMESILEEEYAQYSLSAEKFNVIPVGLSLLSKYVSFGSTIEHDIFMALEVVYAGRRLSK